jgi:hypothetical protein
MKIKTAEATSLQLDWLVAKAEGLDVAIVMNEGVPQIWYEDDINRTATCTYKNKAGEHRFLLNGTPVGLFGNPLEYGWCEVGPILEREFIDVFHIERANTVWETEIQVGPKVRVKGRGPTPLIAAMRCYCYAKFGDEVEIPEELCRS